MKKNKNVSKTKSKIMIGLFGFLGVLMVATIAVSNFTSKGTYSVGDQLCCPSGWSLTDSNCVQVCWGESKTDCEKTAGISCTPNGADDEGKTRYYCTQGASTCPTSNTGCSTASGYVMGKSGSGYEGQCVKIGTSCGTNRVIDGSGNCVIQSTPSPTSDFPEANCNGAYRTFPIVDDAELWQSRGFTIKRCINGLNDLYGAWCDGEVDGNNNCIDTGKCYVYNHKYQWFTASAIANGVGSAWTQVNVSKNQCAYCEPGYVLVGDEGEERCVNTRKINLIIAEGTTSNGSFEVNPVTNKIVSFSPTTNCGTWSTVPCTNGNCTTGASAQNSAYSGLAVGASYPSTGPSVLYCKAGTSIHPGTQTPTPTGGGKTPTPTSTAPSETKSCYVCSAGGKTQYIKATSSANAAAAASELGTITAANCAKTSESNCTGASVSNCYKCNGSKQYVIADGEAAAKTRSGGTTCTIVTMDKCDTTPSSNPKTGTVGIIIAWIVGMGTIIYAMWYYRKSASLN